MLAISVLKRLGGSTILENNIVQTIGSAGESVAGGVVFTIPALIFLTPDGPGYFNYFQITMLAFAGGILGVLMMVPLRRALIVKEHGVLPYPEGAACADVLVAGERGGALARDRVHRAGRRRPLEVALVDLQIFRTGVGYTMARTSFFPNATLNVDISPEYMGVGYVIGPRIAGVDVRGRRAVVAGAAAAPDAFWATTCTVPVPARAGQRPADRSDDGESVVERLHPLHRRGCGAGHRASSRWPARSRRSSRRSATA